MNVVLKSQIHTTCNNILNVSDLHKRMNNHYLILVTMFHCLPHHKKLLEFQPNTLIVASSLIKLSKVVAKSYSQRELELQLWILHKKILCLLHESVKIVSSSQYKCLIKKLKESEQSWTTRKSLNSCKQI